MVTRKWEREGIYRLIGEVGGERDINRKREEERKRDAEVGERMGESQRHWKGVREIK